MSRTRNSQDNPHEVAPIRSTGQARAFTCPNRKALLGAGVGWMSGAGRSEMRDGMVRGVVPRGRESLAETVCGSAQGAKRDVLVTLRNHQSKR